MTAPGRSETLVERSLSPHCGRRGDSQHGLLHFPVGVAPYCAAGWGRRREVINRIGSDNGVFRRSQIEGDLPAGIHPHPDVPHILAAPADGEWDFRELPGKRREQVDDRKRMHLEGFFVGLVWQARKEFAQADRQVSMVPFRLNQRLNRLTHALARKLQLPRIVETIGLVVTEIDRRPPTHERLPRGWGSGLSNHCLTEDPCGQLNSPHSSDLFRVPSRHDSQQGFRIRNAHLVIRSRVAGCDATLRSERPLPGDPPDARDGWLLAESDAAPESGITRDLSAPELGSRHEGSRNRLREAIQV